jgi:hypothetical protein
MAASVANVFRWNCWRLVHEHPQNATEPYPPCVRGYYGTLALAYLAEDNVRRAKLEEVLRQWFRAPKEVNAMAKVNVGFDESESWAPEPGDKIEGTIVRKDTVLTQYGDRPLLEIDADGGRKTVWCGTTVLGRLYEKAKVGYFVSLTYEGEVENPKSGRTYKNYAVDLDDLT